MTPNSIELPPPSSWPFVVCRISKRSTTPSEFRSKSSQFISDLALLTASSAKLGGKNSPSVPWSISSPLSLP